MTILRWHSGLLTGSTQVQEYKIPRNLSRPHYSSSPTPIHKSAIHHGPLQCPRFPPHRCDIHIEHLLIRYTDIAPHPPLTGANREVKKAVEAYWAGKISADDLTKAAADVKKASWTGLKQAKVDLIPRFVVIAV